MKTLFKIIIVVCIALLLAIWSPWYKWDFSISKILGYTPPEQISGLQVNSLAGELTIYLDDKELGKVTPDNSPFEEVKIDPGLHKIRLVRTSDPAGFYAELSKMINFEPGIDVILSYDLGPADAFIEGHTFTAQKKKIASPTQLSIKTTPASASVYVDDIFYNDKLVKDLDLSQQHKIKVTSPGYENLEFIILPDKQEDRDDLKDYDLQLDVNLTLIPLEVTTQ